MKLGAADQSGENFFRALSRAGWRKQEAEITDRADALLARFNLTHMREEYAGELSGGQRKLLEMARALMSGPHLLMLDEPMAGVNPALAQTIIGHVQDLRDEGLTVLFVEHDMDVVRTISDWVVVMSEGEVIAEGRHSAIVTNARVIDAYLLVPPPPLVSEQDRILPRPSVRSRTPTPQAPPGEPCRARPEGPADVGTSAEAAPDADEEAKPCTDAVTAEPNGAEVVLEADEVVAGYVPEVNILSGTNLKLYDGELVGIIGPTAPASRRSSRPCSA